MAEEAGNVKSDVHVCERRTHGARVGVGFAGPGEGPPRPPCKFHTKAWIATFHATTLLLDLRFIIVSPFERN